MQTKQVIQTSANVIKITNVSVGDVYKRFDKDYDDRVYFGLVKNVHNDGENAVIEALEFRAGYYNLEMEYRVLKGEKDYILFPSSPDELKLQFEDIKNRKEKDILEAEDKIKNYKKQIKEIEGLISGETQKTLRAMDYRELSQADYEEKKRALLG